MASRSRTVLGAVGVHLTLAVVLVGAVLLGRQTVPEGGASAVVWPAAGVAMWWVLAARALPWGSPTAVVLIGLLTGGLNIATGTDPLLGVVFGCGNALQSAMALVVITRIVRARRVGSAITMRSIADLGTVAAGILAGTSTGALCGPVGLWLARDEPLASTAGTWILRNAVGAAVIVPAVLRFTDPGLARGSVLGRAWRQRPVELVFLCVATVVVYTTVFGLNGPYAVAFIPVVLSVWAAMRMNTTTAAVHFMAVATAATWFTLGATGPFGDAPVGTRATLVQAYVAVLVSVTWIIALQRDERDRLLVDLEAATARALEEAHFLLAVVESSGDALVVYDKDGRVILANKAAVEMVPPLASNDFDGSAVIDRVDGSGPYPDDLLPPHYALDLGVDARADMLVRTDQHPQGRIVHAVAKPFATDALPGQPSAVVLSARDVTDERTHEQAVIESRDQYAMLLAAATEQAIIACDEQGVMILANVGAERMLHRDATWFVGRHVAELHDSFDLELAAATMGVNTRLVHVEHARRGLTIAKRWRWRSASRTVVVVEMTITPTPNGGFLCVASDVSAAAEAESKLLDSEARFRQAFDTAPVSMFLVPLEGEEDGLITATNSTASRFLGREASDLRDVEFAQLAHPDDRPGLRTWLANCRAAVESAPLVELRFVTSSGATKWGLLSASVVSAEPDSGTIPHMLCLVEDVTARRAAEEALVRQALHDDLTGLPNRVLLRERLAVAVSTINRDAGKRVGVLVCDLDGFKDVNDVYGHAVGDEVLREVAVRFAARLRPTDTLARLGGDEFAVVCPEVSSYDELAVVAGRLLSSLERPVTSTRAEHQLGVSIGVVIGAAGSSVEGLIAHADAAMYEAKRSGKNTYHAYDDALRARGARTARLLPELVVAVEKDEFMVYGQPVVDAETGVVVAVETLLRWNHPIRGVLAPGDFLDVLETSPHMVALGRKVLTMSCQLAASWPANSAGEFPAVHVNISGRQLAGGAFVAEVTAAMKGAGLDPHRLVLELTETSMPQLGESLVVDLQALRAMGVRIAIDDLGTGYSSLARLTELPLDMLKIDRSFVSGMGSDDRCDAVVRAVLSMGTALTVDVVAEGVETPGQHHELARLGCRYSQGYLYSKPLPEDQLDAAIRAPWAGSSFGTDHKAQAQAPEGSEVALG